MDSGIMEEVRMMQGALARFLDQAGGLDPARRAHEGRGDGAVWTGLAEELQLCGLSLPEDAGGLGLGLGAFVPMAQELGRVLSPVPYVGTVGVSAAILAAAGDGAMPVLSRIAEGQARVALANWSAGTCLAVADGEGYRLSGAFGLVPEAPDADVLLVLAQCDGTCALFALEDWPTDTVPDALDPTRPVARIALDDSPVSADCLLGWIEPDALAASLARGRIALAAEAAGAARGAFDLTRAYIDERRQFGRQISSYQAIKHRVSALFTELNALDALVAGAAEAADQGDALMIPEARAAWAMAQALQLKVAAEAIQLHGGVGATWEYAPHLFFKRARAQAAWPDASDAALQEVGRSLLAGTVKVIPDVAETPFRRSVRDWLAPRLDGAFATIRDRGHAGDGDADVPLRKTWEAVLAEGRWVGLGLPQVVGGRGLSVADQVAFYEEYAALGGPGRMGHIGEGLVAPTLVAFGTEDQKERHLPGILEGRVFWAQGYSEPGAGSDLAAVRTRARECPETGDWVVTGQKTWTSLAHVSDWIFVLARCEEGSKGRDGLIFLLMPLDQDGIEFRPIRQINGAAEFNEVFFDGARARATDVVGAPGDGWRIAMALLGFERGISTLGQQMGFARELASVVTQSRARRADHLAGALGRAWAGLRSMRHGALRMLEAQEAGEAGAEMLGYKLEWSEWHRALGDLAMDVLGHDAAAWSDDPETRRLQHLYLFSRADTIYGGTSEIQLNIIAERGLGMPREPRGGQ